MSPEKIRVVQCPIIESPHVPTLENLSDPIDEALNQRGKKIVEGEEFSVIALDSIAPHHPTYIGPVLWSNKNNENGKVTPWVDDHLPLLTGDKDYWEGFEAYIDEQREIDPTFRFYGLIGFALPNPNVDFPDVLSCGMQTQKRFHFHQTLPIFDKDNSQPSNHGIDIVPSTEQLSYFINIAGNKSVSAYKGLLEEFGRVYRFEKNVLINNQASTIQRDFLTFNSLQEAVKTALDIQELVIDTHTWLDHAIQISTEYDYSSHAIKSTQSCIPNMTVVYLSENEQVYLGVAPDQNAAIFPFSLSTPTSIFEDVILKRD